MNQRGGAKKQTRPSVSGNRDWNGISLKNFDQRKEPPVRLRIKNTSGIVVCYPRRLSCGWQGRFEVRGCFPHKLPEKERACDLKCLFKFWRLKRFSFTSEVACCLLLSRPVSLVLCTCAIIKACRSCPLPVKKETSFFMSPVATQYGMASSLSSAISWSARLRSTHQAQHIRCKWQLHSCWQWLAEVILVNEYLILMTNSTIALSGDYVSLRSCTSLVKSENESGPKQLLCGTPHTTVRQTPIKKTKQCLLATKAL